MSHRAVGTGPASRASRSGLRRNPRFPFLTTLAVGATAVVTYMSRQDGSPLKADLARDAGGLEHGDWWRALSPVLVQTDPQVWQVVGTLVFAAAVGAFAERNLGPLRAGTAFLAGALLGEAAGYAWEPDGTGGISVAAFGQLGLLGAWFVNSGPRRARLVGALLAVGSLADIVVLRDLHGVSLLGGLGVGLVATRGLPPVDAAETSTYSSPTI